MSGFNVHVNRFPVTGTVGYAKYVPGKKWLRDSAEGLGDKRALFTSARSRSTGVSC